jgi:hypothetical protein
MGIVFEWMLRAEQVIQPDRTRGSLRHAGCNHVTTTVVEQLPISYHVLSRGWLQPSCLRSLRLRPVNSGVRLRQNSLSIIIRSLKVVLGYVTLSTMQ